ncbi:MAG: hypothetical protein JEZ08_21360 [Clostridiales bacterium]|nr:hypothetical protein [Clostridiales bacterium]
MSNNPNLYFGSTLLNPDTNPVSLETVTLNNETYFKIENYDKMNPFFMTIVSDVDLWMYISSTGGLTCGRKNAESALFPYYTDDKIHDSNETTGSHTVMIVTRDDKSFLWQPFSAHNGNVYEITRNIYKNTIGNKIVFEEINHDLEVSYSYTWKSSDSFGFIKESKLVNLSEKAVDVKVLDGIRNIMPYGINTFLQTNNSTLADGYKRCELQENVGLGIYNLSSIVTDKAEPSESLKATTVWSIGLTNPIYLLSEQQINAFSRNENIKTEFDVKGRRGAYYVSETISLDGDSNKNWYIVAELNQNASRIEKLMKDIKENTSIIDELESNVSKGDQNLKKLVYDADGYQSTADEKAGYRHFSNTLYNIMRGGIYADGYKIDRDDYEAFVENWNKNVYAKHQKFIKQLPKSINYNELLLLVEKTGSKDLERLTLEYLPLTYSRRHGDPSRPWNKFNIEIAKENGEKELKFEGNWRDIFQNWEALSISFPSYIESIIAKFVNASTADGYNPYRITKEGIDWEKFDPEDPWSNIGYWGDHQIIYLLKLIELSKAYNPEKLKDLLQKDIFVYANVPYRIKGFNALVADPRNSITFDDELEASIAKKTNTIGSDGKLMADDTEIYKVNLMEKLLVTLLSKFSNYVPEGGIWMNTQRPEWNDANNALVGYGLSMVTLYYLHRFQTYMGQIVDEIEMDSIEVSEEVLQMFNDTLTVLKENKHHLGEKISDETRFLIVKSLGQIGESYRNSVYNNGFTGKRKTLAITSLKEFIDISMVHLKDTISKNKREDGLYHSYNLIKFFKETCSVSNLYEMLEGQVSVLSSKALDEKEAIEVLESLRNSSIYRKDQNSYMLYPNRELPEFLLKNVVPETDVMSSSILKSELERGLTRFIEEDINGKYHFNGQFKNGDEISNAMKVTGEFDDADIKVVEELYTELFNHHAFTGRSGTFYKYEGLGSIYWHMVSKLLLATQENFNEVYNKNGMNEEAKKLHNYYEAIKDGIGLNKSPESYGAFPTDAYSHTPGFAGVQQPGMTGQVKEDFISRFGELGVKVESGLISFKPVLLSTSEFLKEARIWSLPIDGEGHRKVSIQLDKNTLGFTFCTVPVIYCLDSKRKIVVCYNDGSESVMENTDTLNDSISQSIFDRDNKINRIKVCIDSSKMK